MAAMWWLIDVAPREVSGAVEVVELVAKDAVLVDENNVDEKLQGGDDKDAGAESFPATRIRGSRVRTGHRRPYPTVIGKSATVSSSRTGTAYLPVKQAMQWRVPWESPTAALKAAGER